MLGISVSPYHGIGARDVAAIPKPRRRSSFTLGIWTASRDAAAGRQIVLGIMMKRSETERSWFEHFRIQLPAAPRSAPSSRQINQAAALRNTMPESRRRDRLRLLE